MPVPEAPGTQRVRYFDDQRLDARDLQDDVTHETRLRELHVRALHGVWGVALGLDLARDPGTGSFQVTQGMAYDCLGREIVLPASLVVGLPEAPRNSNAPAWWFDLLIRYAGPGDFEGADAVGAACPADSPAFRAEHPAWRWCFAGEAPTAAPLAPGFAPGVRLGEEVPLGRVRLHAGGAVDQAIDLTVRRVARSLARPHIANDTIAQGSLEIQGDFWHWTAHIDTSKAGFNSRSPFYLATLGDHPWHSPMSGFAPLLEGISPGELASILGSFVTTVDPSRTGFTIEVRSAAINANDFARISRQVTLPEHPRLPVPVRWVGIEPAGGCRPRESALYVMLNRRLLSAAVFQSLIAFQPHL